MTSPPFFLITIDTEGDNLWSRPREVTTENSRYLPRFQELCERYGFKPTWLVNYEMAMCPVFRELGRDVLHRGTGEIGMHLHAWNSPPILPLTENDFLYQPYLIEYPEPVMRQKIDHLTDLLEDTFQTPILSHRAGRWAFDETYARLLLERGYKVDCSVTPHISWHHMKGDPHGRGGPNYVGFPQRAYFLDQTDLRREAKEGLLEVPMTIRPTARSVVPRLAHRAIGGPADGFRHRVAERLFPSVHWLRPNGRNLRNMIRLMDDCRESGIEAVEFMIHSSELMPGGHPKVSMEAHVDRLFAHMEELFGAASASGFGGSSLCDYVAFASAQRDRGSR